MNILNVIKDIRLKDTMRKMKGQLGSLWGTAILSFSLNTTNQPTLLYPCRLTSLTFMLKCQI